MFLTTKQILKLGLQKVGRNVKISDRASIYSPEKITIGDNVRIDDFCILSGQIEIGKYVHIACHSVLIGSALIRLCDFSGVSLNCVVLSSSDDYSGEYMTNPMIDAKYKNTHSAPVVLNRHALLGANCVVLPGVSIGIGATIGACSFVKHSVPEWQIWAGNPLRFIKERNKDILKLERQMLWGRSSVRAQQFQI